MWERASKLSRSTVWRLLIGCSLACWIAAILLMYLLAQAL